MTRLVLFLTLKKIATIKERKIVFAGITKGAASSFPIPTELTLPEAECPILQGRRNRGDTWSPVP